MRARIVIAITFPLWLGLAATIVTGEANPIRSFTAYTNGVNSVVSLPDGLTLASGSDFKTARLWDVDAILDRNELPLVRFATYTLPPTGARRIVQLWLDDRAWFDTSDSFDPNRKSMKRNWNFSDSATTSIEKVVKVFRYGGEGGPA